VDALFRLLLTNAASAGALALVAFAASRAVRRPALAHGLWLLALVKLVAPPVVPLPLVPDWRSLPRLAAPVAPTVVQMEPRSAEAAARAAAPMGLATPTLAPSIGSSPAARPATATTAVEPRSIASLARAGMALVVAAGALAVLLLGCVRYARFARLVASAEPAPAAIRERATSLAGALGLGRVPPVRLVAARIPPMLWPEPSGPVMLLPRDLLRELGPAERDTLVAHELAHVRRRDHWVRLVELAATALFWWYPVAWWARSALRRAEERCCDEWVLRVLPGSAQAYANGLLKSLTFVSAASSPVPVLASGASPLYELETRLKEILMSRPAPRLSAPLRVALLAAAGFGLAVFPTHARSDDPATAAKPADAAKAQAPVPPAASAAPAAPAPPSRAATAAAPAAPAAAAKAATAAAPAASRAHQDAERALVAERLAFEQKQLALQRRELELRRQEIELQARAEQDEARACAERNRADGKPAEAEACERRSELAAKRMVLDQHRVELGIERLELEAKQQAEELALRAELDGASAQGREAEEQAVRQLERYRAKVDQERAERNRALEREAAAAEQRVRAVETERRGITIGAASEEFARALAAQIEASRSALDQNPDARPDIEREIQRLEAALAALKAARP